ncbi:MAG: TolC family protein, partial [Bacteroidota bacterium]
FPELDQANYSAESELAQLLGLARTNRADLQFLSRNKEALEEGMKQVRNSLKPQLNLGGFVNYGGADPGRGADRFVTALGQREGRSMQVGFSLNYLFPLNNNLAQANYLAQNVAISDQQVVLDNQLRNIELNVSIAFNNLRNSVETLEKAKETLNFYEQVFDNEQIKFQNGMTTILNLILFQERLTFAQLDYLSSQQQFATAITNLRFETGTLYQRKDQSTESLDPVIFYQLPGTR